MAWAVTSSASRTNVSRACHCFATRYLTKRCGTDVAHAPDPRFRPTPKLTGDPGFPPGTAIAGFFVLADGRSPLALLSAARFAGIVVAGLQLVGLAASLAGAAFISQSAHRGGQQFIIAGQHQADRL